MLPPAHSSAAFSEWRGGHQSLNVPEMWVLTHRDAGPIQTFTTQELAERARERVLAEEPEWGDLVTVEPFEFMVEDTSA